MTLWRSVKLLTYSVVVTELDRVKEDPPTVGQTIAAQIRAYRLKRGWSVRHLAEECARHGAPQLTQASLENVERGQDPNAKRKPREVSVEELLTLAYVLNARPADLMFKSSFRRVQVTPQITAHPYIAWSWLTGHVPYMATYFDRPKIWGSPIQTREEMGAPITVYGWSAIDSNLFQLVMVHQGLSEMGEEAGPFLENEQYISAVRRLGIAIDDFLSGESVDQLPLLPSWVVEDLQKAQAKDLIKMQNGSETNPHPRTDPDGFIRARLPRDLPTYQSERP